MSARTGSAAAGRSPGAAGLVDPEELLGRAEDLVSTARPGEQIDVSLGASVDTEIRAYGGAIESLSSARSEGALVRVIVDGRIASAP